MPTMVATTGPVSTPNSSRAKPRLAVRGKARKMIRDLKRKLQNVVNLDEREEWKGVVHGYAPYLFKVRTGSANDNAMKRLIERCNEVLAERI